MYRPSSVVRTSCISSVHSLLRTLKSTLIRASAANPQLPIVNGLASCSLRHITCPTNNNNWTNGDVAARRRGFRVSQSWANVEFRRENRDVAFALFFVSGWGTLGVLVPIQRCYRKMQVVRCTLKHVVSDNRLLMLILLTTISISLDVTVMPL